MERCDADATIVPPLFLSLSVPSAMTNRDLTLTPSPNLGLRGHHHKPPQTHSTVMRERRCSRAQPFVIKAYKISKDNLTTLPSL